MRHLFIVTYGRSGSTALQMALNALPGFCIRGENGGLLAHLFRSVRLLEDAKSGPGRDENSPENPWFGISTIDTAKFRSELADLFTARILQPPPHCKMIGFKEIRYLPSDIDDEQFFALIDFMAESFPDARFIFLTRDPRQTARSGMWAYQSRRKAIAMMTLAIGRFRKAQASHASRSFSLDHADLHESSSRVVELATWLGAAPEPALAALEKRLTHLSSWAARGRVHQFYRSIKEALRPKFTER